MSRFVCIVLPFVYISLIFACTFWFICWSCIVSSSCVAFSFLFLIIPSSILCFIILTCFRRFFIYVSSRNSHPGFDFSSVLFERILIFSQSNFAPAWICSFNSVILFVTIYVSTSFILFDSALTVLHSLFLNNCKVVFSLFKILFKFSRFNFCSCDSVCSGLFGCAVFGCVGFPFSEVGGSFRLGCFCSYLMCQVLYSYLVDHLFSAAFILFQGQKTNPSLFMVLTRSASLWLVIWKLEYSF